jgi:hypothetical protein
MKKIHLIALLLQFSILGSCQNTDLFDNYLNKFTQCNLPINLKTVVIDKNQKQNITQKEFNSFVKSDTLQFWQYIMYDSKAHPNIFFEYNTLIKFDINDMLIGVIHLQSYFNSDITKERYETVLTVFNKQSNKLSSLSIAGFYNDNFQSDIKFDEIDYTAIISSEYEIEITYDIYKYDPLPPKSTYKKYYQITNDGKIEEISTRKLE